MREAVAMGLKNWWLIKRPRFLLKGKKRKPMARCVETLCLFSERVQPVKLTTVFNFRKLALPSQQLGRPLMW